MSDQSPSGPPEPQAGGPAGSPDGPTGPEASAPPPDPTAPSPDPTAPSSEPTAPSSEPTAPTAPTAPLAPPSEPVPPAVPPAPGQPGGPATQGPPDAPWSGQPSPGHWAAPWPGQPVPGQPMPGQPWPGQPMPGQPWPGRPYPDDPAAGQPQGWAFPPTGGFPPGAGPYAGFPPGYQPYGWPAGGGLDPDDPLVNPPYAGVNGWTSRCLGALRRGWRILLPLMLLTQAVPAAVVSLLSLGLGPSEETLPADGSLPDGYLAEFAAYGSAVLVASLLLGFAQSLGWAAGTWVVARQAAGEPADLGGALRYGLRRALGLWGWSLLITAIVTVGFCFCLLPGVYLAFALALAGPVYLFERQNPIGRSFRFFHDRLGLVLGRVALVAAAVIVGSVIGGMLEGFGTLPFGTDPLASPGTAVGAVLVIVLSALVVVPVYLAQLVGLVVTYAEQRAHEAPVNAARLAAELG
ncbi:hypothetical protein [Micromonospora sp. DT47]|uniref:hypothetical protein n=1 Tax=Micromonospora sp. DT47 TaxID=3393431 RepID=UPI003CF1EC70